MAENPLPHLVRDLMTVGVLTCPPKTPITEAARLLLEKDVEAIVVLDDGKAVGVVSQNDLLKAFARQDWKSLTVDEVMREGVPQIPPDIPLSVAAQIMQDLGVDTLFLMHHAAGIEYPAAAISVKHLLRLITAQDGEELRDLGINAERQSPLEIFLKRRDTARQENLKR